MNPEVKLVFQNQSEIHAFEAVCSAALKTGDIGIARVVTGLTERLGQSVAEYNKFKESEVKAAQTEG